MPFLPGLDSREIYFLVSIGALFALTGLFLMIRPPRGAGATRIEVLGLKLNASSGGLVVFLIGAGFVGLPVLAPAAAAIAGPSGAAARIPAVAHEVAPASLPGPSAVRSDGGEFITLRRADATEVEENDDQFTANHIAVGSALAGTVAYGDPDWVAFKVDLAHGQRIAIRLRSTENTGDCWMALFDAQERRVNYWYLATAPAAVNVSANIGANSHFMLMLKAEAGGICGYELFVDYA